MSRLHHRVGRAKRSDKPILRPSRDSVVLPAVPGWARVGANPELQQELERCLKLRDGASRIVLLAQNRLQQLDALKTLFVTNEQVLLCLQRVQREKVEDALSTNQSPDSSASGGNSRSGPVVVRSRHHAQVGLAKLCLSDIRIPLLWRDGPLGVNMQILLQRLFPQSQSLLGTASLLTGAGDSADRTGSGEQCEGGHAVFCLARLGHTVRETRLIFDIRPGTSDVEFDDRLTFDNVTEDFRLVFEIYAYPPSISARAASVFSRCRTLLLDNTRRNLDVLDSAQATGKGSLNFSNFFELIGRSVVTLNDLQNHIRAHALATGPHLLLSSQTLNPPATCLLSTPVSPGSPGDDLKVNGSEANSLTTASDCVTDEALRLNGGQITAPDVWMGTNFSGRGLPLFGSVCFRLVAQPHSAQKPLHTGWLWIRKLTASPAQSPARLYWCELLDRHLWAYSIVEVSRRDLSRISETQMTDDEFFMTEASTESQSNGFVHRLAENVEVDDQNDSQSRITLNSNSREHSQLPLDNCPVVDPLLESERIGEPVETPVQQPIWSAPQMAMPNPFQFDSPPPNRALHRRTTVSSQLNGTPAAAANGSSRILRLVLAITPKTLFLDSSPTLRPISVCLSEDVDVHNMQSESYSPENQSPPHPQLPSSMRYHSTSTSTRHSLLSPVDSTQPLPIPATKRPINSPKATRKMRIIKAQARSRSLSNVKLLSSVAATGELDPMMQTPTGPGLAMTLPMRRSTRPTLEDNLPWFNSPSKYRLHSNEPSSPLPDLMLDNVISTRRLSSSMDLICPVTKSKLFQSKGTLAETLPRPDRKKRRDVTLNRLSRSLDTICTNQRFLGFTQIGMRTVDTEDTRSLSDAGSVVSEPVPDPPVVECSAAELSQSSTKQLALFTFRIATTSRVLGTTGSLISSPLDEELTPERFTVGCCVKSSEVFEFGVSKPGLQDALKSTVDNTSVSLESDDSALFANAKGTEHWLTMFQAHVAEQSTWGPDAFSKTVRIPEVHSTARDAGTRRSLAFF